ncbi:hypothetical protein ACFFJX_09245 [Pseudarcicella hirudinis]|uniref:hypothetical protein n=1 Tax=Pseudarcicella hirudinis TaxID=1079859 RepID=UPI0035EA8052
MDIYSTLQYVDNRFTAITSQKIQKVVRRNGTPGTDCDFAGNRAIQDCIESITDASQYKQYEILVYEGIYEATQTTDYNSAGITTGMVSFLRGKSFVSVRGVSRDRVIIRGSLPSNLSSSVYQYYQTAYWHADFGNLEEVSIENTNGRYPLHIDGGQTGCAFFTSNIINVRLVHNGNTGNATAWSSWHPLGLGTSNGQIIVAKNAIFISKKWPQYVHNNSNFTKPSSVTYNSCRFETLDPAGDKIASKIQSLGSSKKDLVEFNNCRFEGCFIMSHDDIPFIPSVLADQYVNHADFRILGSGNSPLLYEPNFKGLALRITSKSTGTTSTVRFDTNSTAFTTVIKDNKYNGDWLNDFGVNNVSGYAYKDGYTGVSGYAIGRLDCGDDKVGIASDLYIKSLGKRLGDCSVTNKTLTVIIDGTSFNIVFNKLCWLRNCQYCTVRLFKPTST